MLENRPEDALVSLVETVETVENVETETHCHLTSCLIVICAIVHIELKLFDVHTNTNTWKNIKHQHFS